MITIAYVRPDKNFDTVGEQIRAIHTYASSNNITIDKEFIDQISQSKRLEQREHVTDTFQAQEHGTLLVYDLWVLSSNMEDVAEMISCLIRHHFHAHFIKQDIVISRQTAPILIFALIDDLRRRLKDQAKKMIGRPKGSKSTSKFDKYISEILQLLKEKKSVSEMSRILNVSRSSLKDYIDSRELKEVAFGSLLEQKKENPEEELIDAIICPNEIKEVS